VNLDLQVIPHFLAVTTHYLQQGSLQMELQLVLSICYTKFRASGAHQTSPRKRRVVKNNSSRWALDGPFDIASDATKRGALLAGDL
jgi:hypothetical protein